MLLINFQKYNVSQSPIGIPFYSKTGNAKSMALVCEPKIMRFIDTPTVKPTSHSVISRSHSQISLETCAVPNVRVMYLFYNKRDY